MIQDWSGLIDIAMILKRSTTLTVLLLAVAALSTAEPDSPIDKGEILSLRRTRRWAAAWAACTNVVECLGTLTLILPLRYLLDLELIYDRLTGTSQSTIDFIHYYVKLVYSVAHLLWERDMLSPNLKLLLVVNLSCDPGQ